MFYAQKKGKNRIKNLLFFFKSKKPKFWHFFEVPPFPKKNHEKYFENTG